MDSQIINSTGIFGIIDRDRVTSNILNKQFVYGLTTNFSYAYLTEGDNGFSMHDNAGSGVMTFDLNKNLSTFIPGISTQDLPYVKLDHNFHLG